MREILKARVGSHLHGLATEESDEDFLGIFICPTSKILGLRGYEETRVSQNPDCTMHEVGKFMRLAAKGNPTILELLFCPNYVFYEYEGKLLIEYREAFLSNHIRDSYGGYAYSQAKKLEKREAEGMVGFGPKTKNRYEKHARHCFRLLRQGKELLQTGTLNPVVSTPSEYFEIGKLSVDQLVQKFEEEYQEFLQVDSCLPSEPDWDTLDAVLLRIRRYN